MLNAFAVFLMTVLLKVIPKTYKLTKRTRTFFLTKIRKKLCTKKGETDVPTHVSEKFSAPICTKIAAPARVHVRAHARTLKV